ncbi:lipopolysaccharide biosynthesis protein [Mucilaginibacter panaciglaebae]
MDLSQKLEGISAVKWALLDRFGSQIILLANTIILARLLSPRDFGLISILYIFMNISSAFVDSGMGGGLIRKQSLSDIDCSTFFLFNVGVALIFYVGLYMLAPVVAQFYQEPLIVILLRLLSITIVINSFALIQKVLLIKNLKFKYVTRSSLFASFFSTAVAIFCAWKGLGIWSLIILQLCQSMVNVCLLWLYCNWMPRFQFSKSSFLEMYAFGAGLFFTSIVNLVFANIYQPIIGKFFSVSSSGYFYQAKRLYEVPVLSISSVVDSVTYPILVKYQSDIKELAGNYQKLIKLLVFVVIPLTVSISLLSRSIVLILLGQKWLFSAQLLRILSFSGIFLILETINGSILKVQGRTKLIFKLELFKKLIIIVNIVIFCQFGLTALVYGVVINSVISFMINQLFNNLSLGNYKNLLIFLINGGVMAVAMFIIMRLIDNSYAALLISTVVGFSVYFLLGYLLKLQEQRWLYLIVSKKLRPVA